MRKVIPFLMGLLMCFSLSVPTSAQTVPTSIAQPFYEEAKDASSELYISGTTATCRSKAQGYSDVVEITVEQTLEKYSGWFIFQLWNNVDGAYWTQTVNGNTISFSNTQSGLESGKYRVKSVFTLTDKQGKTETITVYSDEKSV